MSKDGRIIVSIGQMHIIGLLVIGLHLSLVGSGLRNDSNVDPVVFDHI